MKLSVSIILLIFMTLFSGCGTKVIKYEPETKMSLNNAMAVIDRLIMEQHPTWRPDFVEINNRYILLGYGTVTNSKTVASVNNNMAVGSSSSNTRIWGDRIYYESTDSIVLYSWKRKFKQWYVVSMVGKNKTHFLRTRNLEEAKKMVNALEVVLKTFKEKGLNTSKQKDAALKI